VLIKRWLVGCAGFLALWVATPVIGAPLPRYISQIPAPPMPGIGFPGARSVGVTGLEARSDGFLIKTSGSVRTDVRRLEELPPRIIVDLEDAELNSSFTNRSLDVNQLGTLRVRVGQFQDSPAITRTVLELTPDNLRSTWDARYVPELGGVLIRPTGTVTYTPPAGPNVNLQGVQLTEDGLVFTSEQPLRVTANWENPNEFRLVFSPAFLPDNFLGPNVDANSPIDNLNIVQRDDHTVVALVQVPPGTRVGDLRPLDSSRRRILLPLLRGNATARSVAPIDIYNEVPNGTGLSITLDAGHGGKDSGAQRDGIDEKDLTLSIIRRLNTRLRGLNFNTTLTRSGDTYPTLADRVRITNGSKSQLFISVHINLMDGGRDDIYGIETYYTHNNSARLAYILHRNIVAKTGAPDRRVRIRNLYVTNQNSVPAVLLEVGFLSNAQERARLLQPAYQDTIVEAITQGLIEYLK
jgi:N-acetylmuramoyl-L-alanine amidase